MKEDSETKLFPPKEHRLRRDLIEVFKTRNNFDDIIHDIIHDNVITLDSNTIIRNNGVQLMGRKYNTNMDKGFPSSRVIEN